jgi:hypothetical protein
VVEARMRYLLAVVAIGFVCALFANDVQPTCVAGSAENKFADCRVRLY